MINIDNFFFFWLYFEFGRFTSALIASKTPSTLVFSLFSSLRRASSAGLLSVSRVIEILRLIETQTDSTAIASNL